jgi:hypothetical protein
VLERLIVESTPGHSAAITGDPRLARKDVNWATGKPGLPTVYKQNVECRSFHLTTKTFSRTVKSSACCYAV